MASEPRVDATSTILETIAELCRQGEMNLELEQLFFSPSEFFTADNKKITPFRRRFQYTRRTESGASFRVAKPFGAQVAVILDASCRL